MSLLAIKKFIKDSDIVKSSSHNLTAAELDEIVTKYSGGLLRALNKKNGGVSDSATPQSKISHGA